MTWKKENKMAQKEKVVIKDRIDNSYLTVIKQKDLVFGELKDAIMFDEWYEVNGVMEYIGNNFKGVKIQTQLIQIDTYGMNNE